MLLRSIKILVGGFNLPLWKMMEFVSWDDEMPNISDIWKTYSKPPISYSIPTFDYCDGETNPYITIIAVVNPTRFHLSQWTKASRSPPPWDAHISVTFRPQSSPSDPARAPTCHATWSSTCPGCTESESPSKKRIEVTTDSKKGFNMENVFSIFLVYFCFYLYGCVHIYIYIRLVFICMLARANHGWWIFWLQSSTSLMASQSMHWLSASGRL